MICCGNGHIRLARSRAPGSVCCSGKSEPGMDSRKLPPVAGALLGLASGIWWDPGFLPTAVPGAHLRTWCSHLPWEWLPWAHCPGLQSSDFCWAEPFGPGDPPGTLHPKAWQPPFVGRDKASFLHPHQPGDVLPPHRLILHQQDPASPDGARPAVQ